MTRRIGGLWIANGRLERATVAAAEAAVAAVARPLEVLDVTLLGRSRQSAPRLRTSVR